MDTPAPALRVVADAVTAAEVRPWLGLHPPARGDLATQSPRAVAVARYALAAAYAHGEIATARPLTLYPAGTADKAHGARDFRGASRCWDVGELAVWARRWGAWVAPAGAVRKGKGVTEFVTAGITARAEEARGRHQTADWRGQGWLLLDNDTGVSMHTLSELLSLVGDGMAFDPRSARAAVVTYASSSHTPEAPRERLALPLRAVWNPETDGGPAAWRRAYTAARWVLGTLGVLPGHGFDACGATPAQPFYPGVRAHRGIPAREAWSAEGLAFDLPAMVAALDALGVLPMLPGERATDRDGAVYDFAPGESSPLAQALAVDHPVTFDGNGRGHLRVCLWCEVHTGEDSPGGTSTSVLPEGIAGRYSCLHTHCRGQRTVADVLARLSPEARAVFDRAMEDRRDTVGLRRIRAQLEHNADGNDASEPGGRELVAAGVDVALQTPGCHAVMPEGGAGKSTHARERMKYLPAAVYLYPSHRLGDEAEAQFSADGTRARRYRGPTSVKNPDGSPACRYYPRAKALESAGGNVKASLCPTCPYRAGCPALARASGDGATVHHGPFALATSLVKKHPNAVLVVDETPPLTIALDATAADLAGLVGILRENGIRRTLARRYAAAVRPLVEVLELALGMQDESSPLPAAAAEWMARPENTAPMAEALAATQRETTGDPWADALACGGHFARPVLPALAKGAAVHLRELPEADATRALFALRVGTALAAAASFPSSIRLHGDRLAVTARSEMAGLIAAHPHVVLLDGTPPLEDYRVLRPEVQVVAPVLARAVAPVRVVVYRSRIGRRGVCPSRDGAVVVDWPRMASLVRTELDAHRRHGTRALLLGTYKKIAARLDEPGAEPVRALLDGWRAEGRQVDVVHFGSIVGLNRWAGWGISTIGDPIPNLDATDDAGEALGRDAAAVNDAPRRTAARDLCQFHWRARDLAQTVPVLHRHTGTVVPDGWTIHDTGVETVARGRPARVGTLTPSDVAEAVRRAGGVRALARGVGLDPGTVRAWTTGRRAVPEALTEKVRGVCTPAVGGHRVKPDTGAESSMENSEGNHPAVSTLDNSAPGGGTSSRGTLDNSANTPPRPGPVRPGAALPPATVRVVTVPHAVPPVARQDAAGGTRGPPGAA